LSFRVLPYFLRAIHFIIIFEIQFYTSIQDMKKVLKISTQFLLFFFLTICTQIGGLALLASLGINKAWKKEIRFKSIISFSIVYLLMTFLIVPFIAPIFGREKVKHSDKVKPTTYMTVLLNRNYVNPALNDLITKTAINLKNSKIELRYLDANFPFIDKFPLLPHLSHNDGKKIDFNLIYENIHGEIVNQRKSISGYGIFESPKPGEQHQINQCINDGYWQYDFTKYVTFGKINKDLKFSEKGNKRLIESILKQQKLGKIFIEPHLKTRMNLRHHRVRYHGCQAVRHDDHIHIQLK
jgi:hypothetical protein